MSIQAILAIGLPTLSVLIGILINRSDAARLDARITTEVAALRSTLTGEVNSLRADIREIRADLKLGREDMREFYRTLGLHEIRLDNLEKK